ncbi:phakinin-like [Poeciliopsis prolifica]|uniref:phakinin-like n=1 Tax=Poeciliopsis prolifica TaxID=188132 RepID=UPI002413CF6C|nr:phakinin-like [Poeciliopsis prolifica]
MPLPRRHSSFLGQSSSEHPAAASGCRTSAAGATMPRGVPVGSGAACALGTRVSRRALGISSVFLQGMRSCAAPVLPRAAGGGATGLNSCLMEYRDKVRALEELNRQLEQQIRLSLDRKAAGAGAWGPLRREWEDIYRQVSEAILENARLMLQTENVQANAEDFKERLDSEASLRAAVEDEVCSLRRVMEEAAVTKAELEEQMESMSAELRHLESRHEQDVRALYSRTAGLDVDEPDAPVETGLDRILAHIRTHWEQLTERNRADTDGYLESKEAPCAASRLSAEEQRAEALKAECGDVSCRIQSLQAETESIRALKRGLENSLSDARHWHDVELQNLGSVAARLEAELSDVRSEIEQQRRDFDMLLSNRQRLEQQISLYHGVLDGEEARFLPSNTPPCCAEASPEAPPPAEPSGPAGPQAQ